MPEFWDSTPAEFFVAIEAWRTMNDPDYAARRQRRQEFARFRQNLERAGVA